MKRGKRERKRKENSGRHTRNQTKDEETRIIMERRRKIPERRPRVRRKPSVYEREGGRKKVKTNQDNTN